MEDSNEKPPDNVAPLKEHLLIMKNIMDCFNGSVSVNILLRRSWNLFLVIVLIYG